MARCEPVLQDIPDISHEWDRERSTTEDIKLINPFLLQPPTEEHEPEPEPDPDVAMSKDDSINVMKESTLLSLTAHDDSDDQQTSHDQSGTQHIYCYISTNKFR
jgi:hypothetical protein